MKQFYLKKVNSVQIVSCSKKSIENLEKSLNGLKFWDLKNFNTVDKFLTTILINPVNKDYNHTIGSKKIWIAGYGIFEDHDYDIPYIASLLVHEAHHITQYFSGHRNYGVKAEKAAYKKQKKFLKKIKYDYAVEWLEEQYKAKWWNSMDKSVKGKNQADKFLDDYEKGKLKIKKLKSAKI